MRFPLPMCFQSANHTAAVSKPSTVVQPPRYRLPGRRARAVARLLRARSSVMMVTAMISAVSSNAWANAGVRGPEIAFTSPNGAKELCVALDPMPGGQYTEPDRAKEAEFCSVDFYGSTHALCPKVFSTSPGTLVYQVTGDSAAFERGSCGGGIRKHGAIGDPISYKMSVNTPQTSATFANSSLIYYHFSRYFRTTAHIPVAVFRSMDRKIHEERVSARGVELSAGKPALKMNHAAWLALQAAEQEPGSYKPASELFTPDGLIYGVMLHPAGKRYNEEINGTRESGWGDGQNEDFQQTAPFLALRSEAPLDAAIEEGKRLAQRNPKLARAIGADATPQQMVAWMSDLVDITLLDFIFSQQDRVGNVDYLPYWYWVDDGAIQSQPAHSLTPPTELTNFKPVHIKRTELGDNDAGVRLTYTNYTKRTGMLEKLRHYRADTYRLLMQLESDFQSRGPLHEYVRTTFGISQREFEQVVANTTAAASILRDSCKAGRLRFDIDRDEFLLTGTVTPGKVSCELP